MDSYILINKINRKLNASGFPLIFRHFICLLVLFIFYSCERPSQNDLDHYGGWNSKKFKATGFFRIENAERWWLVTPDGSAFLSFGLNHASMPYLLRDYNIDYWKEQFGAKDAEDPAFVTGFVNKVLNDMDKFGMNTLGCHTQKEVFGDLTIPYVQGLFFAPTSYWMEPTEKNFLDVYSDDFVKRCERISQRLVSPKKNDPFLLGYTFTNVPILTDLDADAHGMTSWYSPLPDMPTWPRSLRNLGLDSPGKQKYVSLMRERHATIRDFNTKYSTRFSSFEELLNTENWSPVVKSDSIEDLDDNLAFMVDIYDRYYKVTCNAVRKYDSNHLIFGDPLNANTGVPDELLLVVARYTDLIPYQHYGTYEEQRPILDHWSTLTGKPLFNTDFAFVVPYEEMPQPGGYMCENQEERAGRFKDFATNAFSRTDFLGWHWCGWVDGWAAWPRQKLRQHSGLQNPFGEYDYPMPEVMSRFASDIYFYSIGEKEPETF